MLSVVSVEKALSLLEENFYAQVKTEAVPTENALSRVLGEDIISDENIPPFDRTTVDGFAVRAADTYGAGENSPAMLDITGEILMGERAQTGISRGECMKISTGGMLPEGSDAAVMTEHTDDGFDGICLCMKSVSPFENVTKKGDDVKQGEKVLEKGRVLSSSRIGVLCALGVKQVQCAKKPLVGIISTGDEIIDFRNKPAAGQIRDINSVLLAALMKENGCEVISYGIIKDRKEELEDIFLQAMSECDTVLLSGGSSKGARDMTAEIISEKGELLFHGLAMKPGKPTILGKCGEKAVFGLPGHPSAAYYVALRLVVPFIKMLTGNKEENICHRYPLGTDIPSNHGREEVVSVRITDGKVYPVFGKSGLVSLLSESDGYIIIDRNREGVFLGEETEVYFTK
ncbi:MAG: molybdopterin molybdotransferase MoeA [Ruminococcaceae bacterium]|nr:molybdopterin molybdotransferase MoeA [Oscillospiraceae bacterium]MBR3595404.1 molybdopterin molybdotransferase MoeA [Clostridia bacterium]